MKIKKNLDLSKPQDRWYVLMIFGVAVAIFLGTRNLAVALGVFFGLLFLVFFVVGE